MAYQKPLRRNPLTPQLILAGSEDKENLRK
jgi:hypothetical protein